MIRGSPNKTLVATRGVRSLVLIPISEKWESNETAPEFVRQKSADVQDPVVAEALLPLHNRLQRLAVDSGYYETYNRPNVTLVDISESPIKKFHSVRIRALGGKYLWTVIMATGFDAMTGTLLKIDKKGRRESHCAKVGGWSAKLSGPWHRRISQPLHDHGPGQPLRTDQHASVHRTARDWIVDV
ncbi:MAG: hypothetical protein Ct9H300mP16_10060 [Pseudomonadota bacterium]|nr:MAG: hypothetical protein Ct9H300mP16_10060 [Pseudomonadota bacterium]